MSFEPFAMERWQSTWENRVRYNLSESGVSMILRRFQMRTGMKCRCSCAK